MSRFLLVLLLLAGLVYSEEKDVVTGGSKEQLKQFQKGRQLKPKPINMNLPVSPLTVNGSQTPEIKLGRVFKLSQRMFSFDVENPSDKDIEYTGIAINCTCTSIINKVKRAGVIPAKGKLHVKIRFNALELKVKHEFMRMIRFELKDYRQFQVNFSGQLNWDLTMVYDGDKERKARTNIGFGYHADTEEKWKATLHFNLEPELKEKLELGKPVSTKNFRAKVYKDSDTHWYMDIEANTPLTPGILQDGVLIPVLSPVPPKGMHDVIAVNVKGVAGSRLFSSAENIYWDSQVDKEDVVTKAFILQRTHFADEVIVKSALLNKPVPYRMNIPKLKVEELKVDKPDCVELSYKQGDGYVKVYCKMDRRKMTEEGAEITVHAPKTRPISVRLAILGDKERAELKAEAEEEARKEAERAAADKEQEEMD